MMSRKSVYGFVLFAMIVASSCGGGTDSESYIPPEGMSSLEIVASDADSLEIGFSDNDSHNGVTQDLTLLTTGLNGSTITWTSSDTEVIENDGTVKRPAYSDGDAEVVLTATLTSGDVSEKVTFVLTVLCAPLTDAEAVDEDLKALKIQYSDGDDAENVTHDLVLSTTGSCGSTIKWSSDNVAVSSDGTVTRPTYTDGNSEVTLTAEVSKGNISTTVKYSIIVINSPATDAESVSEDAAKLVIEYSGTDSAGSVTQSLMLSQAGANGTSIDWTSDNENVIATDGTVNRPTYTDGNAEVNLTAIVSKGENSISVSFSVNVIKSPATDAESVAEDAANLAIGYSGTDSAGSVTESLTLPVAGSNGTTIEWVSDTESVIAADGTVTRPSYYTGNASVSLKATISKGDSSKAVSFTLIVIKADQTDEEAVNSDKALVAITYASGDSAASVTKDITLPTSGTSGSTISWTSSDEDVVLTDGTVYPSCISPKSITLTATVSKGSSSATAEFSLTVPKFDLSGIDIAAGTAAAPEDLTFPVVSIGYSALGVSCTATSSSCRYLYIRWSNGSTVTSEPVDGNSGASAYSGLSSSTDYTLVVQGIDRDGNVLFRYCDDLTTAASGSTSYTGISTAEELAAMTTGSTSVKYYLMYDLSLAGTTWSAKGTFQGNFNGGYHTISDITVSGRGFFSALSSARVQNITLSGLTVDTESPNTGGLVGSAVKTTLINCHVIGSVTSSTSRVGGLIGYLEGTSTVTKCSFNGTVKGLYWVGGLIGNTYAYRWYSSYLKISLSQCYASGSVISTGAEFGETAAGGFIGRNYGQETIAVSNSYAMCDVTSNAGGYTVGGFVGKSYSTYSSGVTGYGDLSYTSCYSAGTLSGYHAISSVYPSGGFLGKNQIDDDCSTTVTNCFYDGTECGYFDAADNSLWTAAGTALTDTESVDITNYTGAGWDTSVWAQSSSVNGGCPYLIENPPAE